MTDYDPKDVLSALGAMFIALGSILMVILGVIVLGFGFPRLGTMSGDRLLSLVGVVCVVLGFGLFMHIIPSFMRDQQQPERVKHQGEEGP